MPLIVFVNVVVYTTVCDPCTVVVDVVADHRRDGSFNGRPAPYAPHRVGDWMGNSFTTYGTLFKGLDRLFITGVV